MKQSILKLTMALVLITLSATTFAQPNAKLIVYRKGCPYGLLAKYQVNINGKEVATLKNNSVYAIDIPTGKHTLAPKQASRAIEFTAESGKTYVVKYKTMIGLLGARPKLKIVTLAEAKEDSKLLAAY